MQPNMPLNRDISDMRFLEAGLGTSLGMLQDQSEDAPEPVSGPVSRPVSGPVLKNRHIIINS